MKSKILLPILAVTSVIVMALIGSLALGLFWLKPIPVAAQTNSPTGPGRTITVVGEGKIKAKPDIAQANIGVEIIGSDMKQATSAAEATMTKLLEVLQAQGVAETDIQTSYFSVWVERPYSPDGVQSTEVIYHVSNNVQVTIRDLTKVTPILGAAIEAGANTINSVTFDVADPTALRSQARQKAVENAQATANELATLNNVTIGEVTNVSEVISAGAYYVSEVSKYAQGVGGGGGGPIVPGEVEVAVQLQISYAIQ